MLSKVTLMGFPTLKSNQKLDLKLLYTVMEVLQANFYFI